MSKKIAVIGAGPNGLVAAKYLRKHFNVTIFEKESKIGGTWNIDKGQPGLTVQSKKEAYCYTDFPFSKHTSKFPTYQEVYDYLDRYAHTFDLYRMIKLNHELVSMQKRSQKGWNISVSNNGSTKDYDFDFVVLANGVFNVKSFPKVENKEIFKGELIHSIDFSGLNLLKGDDIVVVGAGKSGLHLATYIKKACPRKKVSLIFRNSRRVLPKRFLGIIHYNTLFFSPFRSVIRPDDQLPLAEKAAFMALKPLNFVISSIVKKITKKQLRLEEKPYFTPENSNGCGSLLLPDYYEESIDDINIFPQSSLRKFNEESVVLSDGTSLNASTIIFATGFKQCINFLPLEYRNIKDQDGQIWLYKHVLHPDLPDLAFASHAIGMNSILNGEICARWICEYLLGNIEVPNKDEMKKIITQQKKYYTSHRYRNNAQSACVTPSDFFWIREMNRDMQKKKKKKLGFWLTDYLSTAYSRDYHPDNMRDL